jgi:hypothetical protein
MVLSSTLKGKHIKALISTCMLCVLIYLSRDTNDWLLLYFYLLLSFQFVLVMMIKFQHLMLCATVVFCSVSCNSNSKVSESESLDTLSSVPKTEILDTLQVPETPQEEKRIRVLIVPCANGYAYNQHGSDATPFLSKYLSHYKNIELLPFPYKAMKGAGYFGVYSIKDCDAILKQVDADYLILNKMKGNFFVMDSSSKSEGTWGYSTKLIHVASMKELVGIHASKLHDYNSLDQDIEAKTPDLVQLLVENLNK